MLAPGPGQLALKRYDNKAQVEESIVALRSAIDDGARFVLQGGSADPQEVAFQLEGARVTVAGQVGTMRAADGQFQQPLEVGVMELAGMPGVRFDVEGSGYGVRVIRQIAAREAEQPQACRMVRPPRTSIAKVQFQ